MRPITCVLGAVALVLSWFGGPSMATPLGAKFVDEVYVDLLQRPPDLSGHDFFTSALDLGSLGRSGIALAVMGSQEYQGRLVEAYFETLLHRPVDAIGRTGFTAALLAGMRDEVIIGAILGSSEYFGRRAGGTDAGFVDALFQDILDRPVDETGRAGFLQLLASGVTREMVASLVLNSLESRQAFVQRCYQSLLHRDADPSGLQSFTSALQGGASNEAVIATIVGSDEYLARLGSDPGGRPVSFGPCAAIALNVEQALGSESHAAVGSTPFEPTPPPDDASAVGAQAVPAPLTIVLLAVAGLGLWIWGVPGAPEAPRARRGPA